MKLSERSREVAEWAALAAVGAAGFFNLFTPNTWDIKHAVMHGDVHANLRDLRRSYVQASLPAAALAVGASLVSGSIVPALAAGLTGLAMVGIYEDAVDDDKKLICLHKTPRIPRGIAPDSIDAAPGSWRRVEG